MTSNGVDRGTENNGGAQVKNRCLAGCNYSIRGLSVNLPHQQQVFLQRWGGDGQKWLLLDRRGAPPPPPNHNTCHRVFTNGQMCSLSAQHPTGYSSLSKSGDRRIDGSRHRADRLITWTPSTTARRNHREPLCWGKTGLLFFFLLLLLSVMGDKGNPTRWKSTPPDKHNDNNFLTIWCLLHPPVAIQTKSSPRKKKKKKKTAPIWS